MTSPPASWLLPTLAGYSRRLIGRDVLAGVTAGAVVIPQGMAYATIANLPVQVGLYTCIVPMLVYAFLGGSKAMSVSTTSTIATLTASTLVTAGVAASGPDGLGSLVTLTLMVGVLLGLLRLLRLGGLIENISSATILGVQVGVGATVAVGQVPKLLGVDMNASGEGFIRSVIAIVEAIPTTNGPTLALSVGAILVLLVLRRFAPAVPGPLVVVVGSILLVAFTGIRSAGVALIEAVPQGLPLPHLPDLTNLPALIPGALGIALMAFLESVAVGRTLRDRADPQLDSDRELIALGAANAIGSFFTVLPAAGGFSQSAVNQSAGARSQIAGLTTVVLAVLTALFLGPVLSLLPEATLAALVFVAVLGLVKVNEIIRLARISPVDFWVATATAAIGLTAGLLAAVGAGVVITLLMVLRELNTPRLEVGEQMGSVIEVRLGHGLYTANVSANVRAILDLVDGRDVPASALVLDVRRLDAVSLTVLDALAGLDHELASRGVTLHLAHLPGAAEAVAHRTDWFLGLETEGRVHHSVAEAMRAASAA